MPYRLYYNGMVCVCGGVGGGGGGGGVSMLFELEQLCHGIPWLSERDFVIIIAGGMLGELELERAVFKSDSI